MSPARRTYSTSSSSCSSHVPASPATSSDSAIDSCAGSPPPSDSHHSLSSANSPSSARKRKPIDKDSEHYKARRERNNEAVRKSRQKSKVKRDQADSKMRELIRENERLRAKVETQEKELQLIRSWCHQPNDQDHPAEMDGQGIHAASFTTAK